MTYKEFLKECMRPPVGEQDFCFWITNCRNELKNENANGVAKTVNSDDLTTVMSGIKKCLKYINDEEKHVKALSSNEAFTAFKTNLNTIDNELEDIVKVSQEDTEPDYKTLLDSYEKKIEDIKKQLNALETNVEHRSNNLDTKLFSVIINTIAILGIFVAIAIAGFGTVSIASNVIIDLNGNILRSTYLVTLIGLIVYNFILLLMYFIIKIVNANLPMQPRFPMYDMSKDGEINNWLIVVDILLILCTVALFFVS